MIAERRENGKGNSLAVHHALWRLADSAEVCATMRQIADACGLGERIVRDSLRELVERGRLIPVGKRGKTTVFRLSSSPTAETPSRRDSPLGGSSSTTERSAAVSHRGISPMEDEDREWLESYEWTPELRAGCAARARALALRYGSGEVVATEAGAGKCSDCRDEVAWRAGYGAFEVCRSCLGHRHAVAMRFAAKARGAEVRAWIGVD